jgi:hypothetical protein
MGQYRESLDELGITISGPEVTREEESRSYSSEIAIYFWRSGDVLDVLEVFAIHDGRAATTEEQAVAWLQKEIEPIISRTRQR